MSTSKPLATPPRRQTLGNSSSSPGTSSTSPAIVLAHKQNVSAKEFLNSDNHDDGARLRFAAEVGYSLLRDKEKLELQVAELQSRDLLRQSQLADAQDGCVQLEVQIQRLSKAKKTSADDYDTQLRQLHDLLKASQEEIKRATVRADRFESELNSTTTKLDGLRQLEQQRRITLSVEPDVIAVKAKLQQVERELNAAYAEINSLKTELIETNDLLMEEKRARHTELTRFKETERIVLCNFTEAKRHIQELETKDLQADKKISELSRNIDEYAQLLKDAQQELQSLEEERSSARSDDANRPNDNINAHLPYYMSELERRYMHFIPTSQPASPTLSNELRLASPESYKVLNNGKKEGYTLESHSSNQPLFDLKGDSVVVTYSLETRAAIDNDVYNLNQLSTKREQHVISKPANPTLLLSNTPLSENNNRRSAKDQEKRQQPHEALSAGDQSSIAQSRAISSQKDSYLSETNEHYTLSGKPYTLNVDTLKNLPSLSLASKEALLTQRPIEPYPDKEILANTSLQHWRLLASPHLDGARGYFGDVLKLQSRSDDRHILNCNINTVSHHSSPQKLSSEMPDIDEGDESQTTLASPTKKHAFPSYNTLPTASQPPIQPLLSLANPEVSSKSDTVQDDNNYIHKCDVSNRTAYSTTSEVDKEDQYAGESLGLLDRSFPNGNIILRAQAGIPCSPKSQKRWPRGRSRTTTHDKLQWQPRPVPEILGIHLQRNSDRHISYNNGINGTNDSKAALSLLPSPERTNSKRTISVGIQPQASTHSYGHMLNLTSLSRYRTGSLPVATKPTLQTHPIPPPTFSEIS